MNNKRIFILLKKECFPSHLSKGINLLSRKHIPDGKHQKLVENYVNLFYSSTSAVFAGIN